MWSLLLYYFMASGNLGQLPRVLIVWIWESKPILPKRLVSRVFNDHLILNMYYRACKLGPHHGISQRAR